MAQCSANSGSGHSTPRPPGILKTPRSPAVSAAGAALPCGSTGGAGSNGGGTTSSTTFFLSLDSRPDNEAATARSSNGSGGRRKKHALSIDPTCQPAAPAPMTPMTNSQFGPATLHSATDSSGHSNPLLTSRRHPGTQARLLATDSLATPKTCRHSASLSVRDSLRLSSSTSCSTEAAAASAADDLAARSSSSGGGCSGSNSGSGSLSSRQHYGAWYLKAADWDYVGHHLAQDSTWVRQSQHLQEHEQQLLFAQQLAQLTDSLVLPAADSHGATRLAAATAAAPAGTGDEPCAAAGRDSSSSADELSSVAAAAADAQEGLAAASPAAAMPQPPASRVLRASNTWGRRLDSGSASGAAGGGASDATAAAAAQYYRQLHQVAKQQAQLNGQLKGTFGLKAYKDFMRTKGFRQSASLQRLPTPTDEDIRLAALRAQGQQQQQQQPRHRLRSPAQQRSSRSGGGSRDGSSAAQQQGLASVQAAAEAGSTAGLEQAAAAQPLSPPAGGAAASGAGVAGVPRLRLSELKPASSSGCGVTAGPARQSAGEAVEDSRVARQLQQLKKTCLPEAGLLDASDWQLLQALLSHRRPRADSSSNSGGSSSCRGSATQRAATADGRQQQQQGWGLWGPSSSRAGGSNSSRSACCSTSAGRRGNSSAGGRVAFGRSAAASDPGLACRTAAAAAKAAAINGQACVAVDTANSSRTEPAQHQQGTLRKNGVSSAGFASSSRGSSSSRSCVRSAIAPLSPCSPQPSRQCAPAAASVVVATLEAAAELCDANGEGDGGDRIASAAGLQTCISLSQQRASALPGLMSQRCSASPHTAQAGRLHTAPSCSSSGGGCCYSDGGAPSSSRGPRECRSTNNCCRLAVADAQQQCWLLLQQTECGASATRTHSPRLSSSSPGCSGGRLSPYASSLVQPVPVSICYTLTPRSARGGGSGAVLPSALPLV